MTSQTHIMRTQCVHYSEANTITS